MIKRHYFYFGVLVIDGKTVTFDGLITQISWRGDAKSAYEKIRDDLFDSKGIKKELVAIKKFERVK